MIVKNRFIIINVQYLIFFKFESSLHQKQSNSLIIITTIINSCNLHNNHSNSNNNSFDSYSGYDNFSQQRSFTNNPHTPSSSTSLAPIDYGNSQSNRQFRLQDNEDYKSQHTSRDTSLHPVPDFPSSSRSASTTASHNQGGNQYNSTNSRRNHSSRSNNHGSRSRNHTRSNGYSRNNSRRY